MSVTIHTAGSFKHSFAFLEKFHHSKIPSELKGFGRRGVDALRSTTPIESGETAQAWDFEIVDRGHGSWTIYWTNSHIEDDVPIAVILQFGHGTGTGGWVEGRDYINPALVHIFDDIAEQAWKVVTSA